MDAKEVAKKAVEALAPNDTAIDGWLYINEKGYELQSFETEFRQPEDYKGKPQHEVKGGLLSLTIKQKADDVINNWMFRKGTIYSGAILFAPISRMANPLLSISFTEGSCISYEKFVGQNIGIQIKLLISAKFIKVGEITHYNNPKAELA